MTGSDDSPPRSPRLSRRRLLEATAGLGVVSVVGAGVGHGAGGEVRWSVETGGPVRSSPTVVDGTVFVGSEDGTLYALDAETGDEVWTAGTGSVPVAPAVAGGQVFVGGTGGVDALDAASGAQTWTVDTDDPVVTAPSVGEETVATLTASGTLHARSLETGDRVWSAETASAPGTSLTRYDPSTSGTVIAPERLLFGTDPDGGSNGAVAAYNTSAELPGQQRGEQQWRTGVEGAVRSSPTVLDGSVLVGGTGGTVHSLSVFSGEREWVSDTGSPVVSSPTAVGNRVVVGTTDGRVFSLDIDSGEQNWTAGTGGPVRSSPTVVRGQVIVGSGDGRLYAFSLFSGDQVWTFETGGPVESSPTVVDGTAFVGSADGRVYAVDAGVDGQSGGSRVALRTLGHRGDTEAQQVTEAFDVDRSNPGQGQPVTFSARFEADSATYEWDLTGDGSVDATGPTATRAFETLGERTVTLTLGVAGGTASNTRTVSVRPPTNWLFETNGRVASPPALRDGTAYVADSDGSVFAVATDTGDREWVFDPDQLVGRLFAPTVVDGTAFVAGRRLVYAVAADTGEEVWSAELDGQVRSSPTVAGGRVFVGGLDGNVYALDVASGDREWVETVGSVRSAPTVAGEIVVVGTSNGVYALAAASGGQLWRFAGPVFESSPTVADETVYAGSENGRLYAIETVSGEAVWTVETGGRVTVSPTVADGTVFAGSSDGTVYAVDAASGEQEWAFELNGSVELSPTVASGTVYAGGGFTLYALDAATGDLRWRLGPGDPISVTSPDVLVRAPPIVSNGTVYLGGESGLYALSATVDGSSRGSRARLGTLGHPEEWRYADQNIDQPDDEPGDGSPDGGTGDDDGTGDGSPDGRTGDDTGDDGFGPGFGPGVALAALGGLYLLCRVTDDGS